MTETVGWLIRVHWHVQHVSGVVGGDDVGDRTGQGAPTGCVGRSWKLHTRCMHQGGRTALTFQSTLLGAH